MRRKAFFVTAIVLALASGCVALAGCTQAQAETETLTPPGAAPVMPVGHQGRYETLGAAGCYGCHGANATANPMLATAVTMPADHYAGGSYTSLALDNDRYLCVNCHVLGA